MTDDYYGRLWNGKVKLSIRFKFLDIYFYLILSTCMKRIVYRFMLVNSVNEYEKYLQKHIWHCVYWINKGNEHILKNISQLITK